MWWDIVTTRLPGSWSKPDHGNRAQRHSATEPQCHRAKARSWHRKVKWCSELLVFGGLVHNEQTYSSDMHKSSLAQWFAPISGSLQNYTVHISADDAGSWSPDGPNTLTNTQATDIDPLHSRTPIKQKHEDQSSWIFTPPIQMFLYNQKCLGNIKSTVTFFFFFFYF